jgi:hypothetical protein
MRFPPPINLSPPLGLSGGKPTRIGSLLSSERRIVRNHLVRAITGTRWLRAEDSRLQQCGGSRWPLETPKLTFTILRCLKGWTRRSPPFFVRGPVRNSENDCELRIALGRKLLNLVAEGVTDPIRLRQLTVKSLSCLSMSLSFDAPGSTYPVGQREWGGRKLDGHHMRHDPPHGALHVLASVNNGAPLTDGNSRTPAQVS